MHPLEDTVGSIAGGSTPLAVGETLRLDFGPALGWIPGLFAELAYTFLPKAETESALIYVDSGALGLLQGGWNTAFSRLMTQGKAVTAH